MHAALLLSIAFLVACGALVLSVQLWHESEIEIARPRISFKSSAQAGPLPPDGVDSFCIVCGFGVRQLPPKLGDQGAAQAQAQLQVIDVAPGQNVYGNVEHIRQLQALGYVPKHLNVLSGLGHSK